MTWNQIAEFTLTQTWQYTTPLSGRLFRLRHLTSNPEARGLISQGFISDNILELFDTLRISPKVEHDLFEFLAPDELATVRRVAAKLNNFSTTSWIVAIDVFEGVGADEISLISLAIADHEADTAVHTQYVDSFELEGTLTPALALKVDLTAMNSALALKADLTAMNSALALKANTTTMNSALDLKANLTAMNSALDLKANLTAMNSALALKADLTAMNTADRDRNFQRRRAEVYSDFITNSSDWISTSSGTGTSISLTNYSVIGNDYESGVATLSTGTTDIGAAGFLANPNAFKLGSTFSGQGVNTAYFRCIFQIPTISTSTESFVLRLGFIETLLNNPIDGVFLRINASGDSEFVARNNNVESAIALNAAIVAGQWYNLEITIPFYTEATLKLFTGLKNTGTPIDTKLLTSNIPNTSTRMTGAGLVLNKSLGLTARTVNIDFLYAGIDI